MLENAMGGIRAVEAIVASPGDELGTGARVVRDFETKPRF
jgi:hypothetical protein